MRHKTIMRGKTPRQKWDFMNQEQESDALTSYYQTSPEPLVCILRDTFIMLQLENSIHI